MGEPSGMPLKPRWSRGGTKRPRPPMVKRSRDERCQVGRRVVEVQMDESIMTSSEKATLLTEDELEPYVRKKRSDGSSRKKLQGLNEQEQNLLRNSINSRERRRMHELNEEFETLRECLPYSCDSTSRRMSKANTLLLATNWIKQLSNANRVLQAELNALRAQMTLAEPRKTCIRCRQPACFSVSCITSTSSTATST